jgi:hypothetical protein
MNTSEPEVLIKCLIGLAFGHNLWSQGVGAKRKGIRPEIVTEPSRARKFMKSKCFLESYLFMNSVGFYKE